MKDKDKRTKLRADAVATVEKFKLLERLNLNLDNIIDIQKNPEKYAVSVGFESIKDMSKGFDSIDITKIEDKRAIMNAIITNDHGIAKMRTDLEKELTETEIKKKDK